MMPPAHKDVSHPMSQIHTPTGALAQDAHQPPSAPVVFAATSLASPSALQPTAVPAPVPAPLDRAKILDATALVLRAHGYDGTTIRRIADQLDCAVGSIYRHFKDKRELLDAVCQRRFDAVAQHAELGTPVARCASLYARVACDQPDLYRLMFWLACVSQETGSGASGLPKVISQLISGWSRQFDNPSTANRFWAQLHGTMMEGLTHDEAMQVLGLTRPVAASQDASPEPLVELALQTA